MIGRGRLTRGRGLDSGDDGTWHVLWNPEGSEGVNFTLVQFLDMNYGDLDEFQRGFNQCLKKRLDEPDAKPVRGRCSGNSDDANDAMVDRS